MSIHISDIAKFAPAGSLVSWVDASREIYYLCPFNELTDSPDIHTLYFGRWDADSFHNDLRGANILLLTQNVKLFSQIHTEGNLILLYDEDSWLNTISYVLHSMNNEAHLLHTNQELLNIILSGGSMQKLLNFGCSILGNPLLLVDISFEYIGSAGTGDLQDHPDWQYTIVHGIMPADYISQIMSEEAKYLDDERTILLTLPTPKNPHYSYSVKVTYQGKLYGYLKVMERDSPFTDYDREFFRLLGKYVAVLSDSRIQLYNFNNNMAENLLVSILQSAVDPRVAAPSLLALSPTKFFSNFFIISIHFAETMRSSDAVFMTHRKLKRFFQKNIVAINNNSFVILYDSQDSIPFRSNEKDVCRMLKELHCMANVSLRFTDLSCIRDYYRQTEFCQEYREQASFSDQILYYSNIYEYQMIRDLSSSVQLRTLIHPAVDRLMQLDRKNDGSLTETLFAYTSNGCSITAASQELFVHYNTVKHRIAKISQETAINFSDKDEIFRINFSQKILRFLELEKKNI